MAIHVIMDGSNLQLSFRQTGPRRPALLLTTDAAITAGQKRGQGCSLIRSQHAGLGDMFWDLNDVSNLVSLGYTDIVLPLARKKATLPGGRIVEVTLEKDVDSRIVVQLFQAVRLAEDGDTIALVSGDKDFLPALVEIGANYEVQVQCWAVHSHAARSLQGRKEFSFHALDQTLVTTSA